ncbi:MAG: hypothetical protein M3Z08_02015 [Chloroflexota bacterium]|nr:hypothetical protein [Chloroflexota bacterium]
MRWASRARITLLLGVFGPALIMLAFFLPYDTISYDSCAIIPPPCPLYPAAARIDWTWRVFLDIASISPRWGVAFSFVILTIPIMLAVRILSFQRGYLPLWERLAGLISFFGFCAYLFFDGLHLLAFANLLPMMGHPPRIHASLAPGFWLPIVGFLFCLISTFTQPGG